MEMKYKVAVVGGGPSGSCAAEILADCDDVDVTLFERKMDNAKPCGGAIPLCMIDEFDLPTSIIDRKVSIQTTAVIQSFDIWIFLSIARRCCFFLSQLDQRCFLRNARFTFSGTDGIRTCYVLFNVGAK